jgi:hypothetical protein
MEELEIASQALKFFSLRPGGIDTFVSHWSKLIEGLQESPQAFYASVVEAVNKRQIPGAKTSHVEWPEGGAGSAKRLYLRVERGDDLIDICGAPFGNAFFVSSWLCAPPPNLLNAVLMLMGGLVLGGVLVSDHIDTIRAAFLVLDLFFILGVIGFGIIRPIVFPPRMTFYRRDTADMFYTAVHNGLMEAVDQLTTAKGVRGLTDDERKPIMRL